MGMRHREPASEASPAKVEIVSCEIIPFLKNLSPVIQPGMIPIYSVKDTFDGQVFYSVEPDACARLNYSTEGLLGYVYPSNLPRGCAVSDKNIRVEQTPTPASQVVYEFKLGEGYFNSTEREKCLEAGIPLVGILGYVH